MDLLAAIKRAHKKIKRRTRFEMKISLDFLLYIRNENKNSLARHAVDPTTKIKWKHIGPTIERILLTRCERAVNFLKFDMKRTASLQIVDQLVERLNYQRIFLDDC